jgi:predicted Fe-S protein YdhL (DUF1289 family)
MSDPALEQLVASPCVGVCTVDRTRNLCIGCLRTLQEIGAWRTMTLDQKRATVAACEERAKSLARLGKDWLPLDETRG